MEKTAQRLKLVQLKNFSERKQMGENNDNVDENALTPVDLVEVWVTWNVATSTVQFGDNICVDQSEGATQTTAMSHL